jgi:hypothetical protein
LRDPDFFRAPRRAPVVRELLRREVDRFRADALRAPVRRFAGLRRVELFRAVALRVAGFRVEALRVARRGARSGGMSEGIPIPESPMPGCSGCIGISSVTGANLPISSSENFDCGDVVWHNAFPSRAQVRVAIDGY